MVAFHWHGWLGFCIFLAAAGRYRTASCSCILGAVPTSKKRDGRGRKGPTRLSRGDLLTSAFWRGRTNLWAVGEMENACRWEDQIVCNGVTPATCHGSAPGFAQGPAIFTFGALPELPPGLPFAVVGRRRACCCLSLRDLPAWKKSWLPRRCISLPDFAGASCLQVQFIPGYLHYLGVQRRAVSLFTAFALLPCNTHLDGSLSSPVNDYISTTGRERSPVRWPRHRPGSSLSSCGEQINSYIPDEGGVMVLSGGVVGALWITAFIFYLLQIQCTASL